MRSHSRKPVAPATEAPPLPRWIVIIPFVFCIGALSVVLMVLSTRYLLSPTPPSPSTVDPETIPGARTCAYEDVVIGVMTESSFFKTRTVAINTTWVQHAKRLGATVLLFADKEDLSFPTIQVQAEQRHVEELMNLDWVRSGARSKGWGLNIGMTYKMWQYLYTHYANTTNPKKWFVKVDDDGYFNAEKFLEKIPCRHTYEQPMYIGHCTPFCVGGPGYYLNLAALNAMFKRPLKQDCKAFLNYEDRAMHACMKALGISPISRQDVHNAQPSLPLTDLDVISYHYMKPDGKIYAIHKEIGRLRCEKVVKELQQTQEKKSRFLHGVDPQVYNEHCFSNASFTCLSDFSLLPVSSSSSPTGQRPKQIPLTSVNNNFCDCEDGSDEPGTRACAHTLNTTYFYCAGGDLEGNHEKILRVKVNDGVCDCCDGSDEWEGEQKVVCENKCEDACVVHAPFVQMLVQGAGVCFVTVVLLLPFVLYFRDDKNAKVRPD